MQALSPGFAVERSDKRILSRLPGSMVGEAIEFTRQLRAGYGEINDLLHALVPALIDRLMGPPARGRATADSGRQIDPERKRPFTAVLTMEWDSGFQTRSSDPLLISSMKISSS